MAGALKPTGGTMGSNGSKPTPAGARVAVVGGGFAGLSTAIALTRLGYDVHLYEEHQTVGWPPHCTGVISSRTLNLIARLLPLETLRRLVLGEYEGAVICALGECATFRVSGSIVRLDRPRLEQHMLTALEGLAEVHLRTRVTRISRDATLATQSTRSSRRYDAIVLAEGPAARLRAALKTGYRGPTGYGVNIVTTDEWACENAVGPAGLDRRYVYSVFDPSLSPGYAWVVPTRKGCILGAASLLPSRVSYFIKSLRSQGIHYKETYGGRLLLAHTPPMRYRAGRVVVTGDSAGLAKPLTGGGLYPQALTASEIMESRSGPKPHLLVETSVARVASRLRRFSRLARLMLSSPRLVRCAISSMRSTIVYGVDYDDHASVAIRLLKDVYLRKIVRCAASSLPLAATSMISDFAASGALTAYRLLAPLLP